MNTAALISILALSLLVWLPAVRGDSGGSLVITGGTLVDGTGRAPLPDSVIVIRDGKIVTVTTGAAESVPAEGDATRRIALVAREGRVVWPR